MTTSIRVDSANRDALTRIAQDELGGASLDEALRSVLFEHATHMALTRLAADPAQQEGYLREASDLAEVDTTVAG